MATIKLHIITHSALAVMHILSNRFPIVLSTGL